MAKLIVIFGIGIVAIGGVIFLYAHYSQNTIIEILQAVEAVPPPIVKPAQVRALYITASMAVGGGMEEIIRMMKDAPAGTAPNAVVIDIQDANGRVLLDERIRTLVHRLRFLNIFPIARFVVFQNNAMAEKNPAWAIHTAGGGLWKDTGGRRWIDPSHKDVWSYGADISLQAVDYGFGEINLDYFRFPSEGVTSAVYPFWSEKSDGAKTEVIKKAALFLTGMIKKDHPEIQVTVDIFGYTFMRSYDLGIGQSAPALASVFDAVYPMIYPSHYDAGNFNFQNPADHPYEVMAGTLKKGKEIFEKANQPFTNIRPWIQDFNLGAMYTPEMVKAQMKAIADAGLTEGWLIWNPRNNYREAIFKP